MLQYSYNYYDLDRGVRSTEIATLFPDWGTPETLVVLSPHDDDALLGAGYALSAARDAGADVHICIFCDGRAGYSTVAEKETIVAVRARETVAAYQRLGIDETRITHLNIPDFSANQTVGWRLDGGGEGTFRRLITYFRSIRATRLLFPNAYREHLDHWGVGLTGLFYGPQAGDPILADWGQPCVIKSYLEYAVWGDFAPEVTPIWSVRSPEIRANRCIVATAGVEEQITNGLRDYCSQARIIEALIRQRSARACREGYVEAYRFLDPRPSLDYQPYARLVDTLNP